MPRRANADIANSNKEDKMRGWFIMKIGGNTGNYFFDPLAFSNANALALDNIAQTNAAALIGQFSYGTSGRNAIRGVGSTNTDVSLSKHLLVFKQNWTESLRVDAFHVFNRANFAAVNTNMASPLFGQICSTNGPLIFHVPLHFRC